MSAFTFELCLCAYACMCVCDHGRVLYGSNYWQRGPSDTHSASHSGPNGMYLPPPFPFLFLSLSVSFSLSPSFYYLSLSVLLSLLFSLWTKLLSYEPQQRGKVKPLSIFYWEQKPQPYFNSHHTFPICVNKP